MGYVYRGTGKDQLTRWMDRERNKGRQIAKTDSNTCRRCRRGYITRYHQEICRAEVLAEYAARPDDWRHRGDRGKKRKTPTRKKCIKCGYDYRSKKHKRICKGMDI